MSTLPLRFRFTLVVALILAVVVAALWLVWSWIGPAERAATFWFAASAVLLGTLLVDQAARWLIYRRLSQVRQVMQQARAGQLDVRVDEEELDEIGVIARGLNDILEGLHRLSEAVDVRVETATEVFRQRNVQLADSHREMAVLSEELARAGRLAALGQAAANMAHQIGTPLNLISAYVQLLLQPEVPAADAVTRLKAIQDQVAKVTAIVRSALDSARPPADPHERADLGRLVRRICQMAAPMLEKAGVSLQVSVSEEPLSVVTDAVQLELALLNLITNSVDAMAAGGSLSVRVSRAADRAQLEIEDTGGGVPPELAARIFDPWVTTKPPGQGSGLGLSITRQVVASHRGTIRVSNGVHGARFTIELPIDAGPASNPQSVHAANSGR
jgi:signal transduction histidine kinase